MMGYKFYESERFKKYYACICPECGWRGLSDEALGGEPLADTGDYTDVVCPKCESDLNDDNRAGPKAEEVE